MLNLHKNSSKNLTPGLLLLILGGIGLTAFREEPTAFLVKGATHLFLKEPSDTLPVQRKNLSGSYADTLENENRGPGLLPITYSKDTLSGPVNYSADDSINMDIRDKKLFLYGHAKAVYQDNNLKADRINLDQASSVVTAFYTLDTAGNPIGKPDFKQGSQSFLADTIRYNFRTKKGVILNTTTQQGEGFMHSTRSKIVSHNTVFSLNGWYTTCDLDTPHFAIHINKAKIIGNKLIVARGAELEFEGVPTPLYLPFFIFPLTHGQRTGVIPPTYTLSQQKGIGLTGLGYYLGLGDHFDLTTRADIYSYGSWSLNINPTYRKRYRYSGNFDLDIATTRFGDPKTPDFNKSRDFRVSWSHTLDPKVHPGISFSASVNAGTSTYNLYNVTDPAVRLNNTLSSSIAFSKVWQGKPFNFTLSASHSQNTTTRQVTLSLPQATFNMNTIYPFQPRNMVGNPKWYERLGISYSMSSSNTANFADSTFLKPGFFQKFQTGVQQEVPISVSIPVTNFLTFTPSANYREIWYTQEMYRHYDAKTNALDTIYKHGFYSAREITTGASLSTRIFGMFRFKKGFIKAIRHVVTPSIGISYKPDLARNFYYKTRIDTSAYEQTFSYLDGSVYGPPSQGRFGGINFGINNNLEMKVYSKKDTVTHTQKIELLNSFGISGSYNLVADSFKLTPLALNASTTLFNKINISASGTIDPYVRNSFGRDINEYIWQTGKRSIGTLTNGNIAISSSFKSPERKNKTSNIAPAEVRQATSLEQQQQNLVSRPRNFGDMVDFNIPWSINLSYSLNFSKGRTPDFQRDTTIYSQSLIFSGDFNLTPKWKISYSSGYDFIHKQLTYTTLNITRDMHCWRMNISIIPYGFYKSFSITINPTSSLLHDLKFNRTRQFYNVFQ